MKTKTPLICYSTETGDPIESDETRLKKFRIYNYSINLDGSLNVFDSVDLSRESIEYLPFEFHYVPGDFYCNGNNLTDLKGSPDYVGGDFSCGDNNLTDIRNTFEEGYWY